jgi:hypothetical protein
VGLEVEARDSYFLAPSLIPNPRDVEVVWHGTGNLYRSLVMYLYDDSRDLEGWRQKLHTDLDSVEEPPLWFDPQQWRLLPDSPGKGSGPGGKDSGADVDRILTPDKLGA